MAALMTSVLDNSVKCSEYLLHCREQKIRILPPSVNEGEGRFTTENGNIRYGMYAIKAIGRSVVDSLVEERKRGGKYRNIRDFIERTYGKDMNKRAIENLIKAGALDCLGGTRKQLMQIYPQIMEQAAYDSKESITGQMSLFDFMKPEQKEAFEVTLPEVGEFQKEQLLAFEKEVLGVYLSGHPLEEYQSLWKSRITATTADFLAEDGEEPKVEGDSHVTIGGMIAEKKVKYTKNNQVMAFITLEDLVGNVEVIVFPKSYEKYRDILTEENKVFLEGRVDADEERGYKLILERAYEFGSVPQELWIAFRNLDEYRKHKEELDDLTGESDGIDRVCIFLRDTKQYTKLPVSQNIHISPETLEGFRTVYGKDNVTVRAVPKSVENRRRMH